MSGNKGFEIERKFLIRMPSPELLSRIGQGSDISQTYLVAEKGCSARVRKRVFPHGCQYTHTEKKRLSDMRRTEHEREIDEGEYLELLKSADPGRRSIEKRRFCVDYEGQTLEIDIFPFYSDRAILEIELEREEQPIKLPPWVELVREVTGDGRYTNAAMAREIPRDEL